MACCLTAPSHCLNQCWLIISKVEWRLSKGKFTRDTSAIDHWNYLENLVPKMAFKFPRGQWVKHQTDQLSLFRYKLQSSHDWHAETIARVITCDKWSKLIIRQLKKWEMEKHAQVTLGLTNTKQHSMCLYASKLRQNGQHLSTDIFGCIIFHENCCILLGITEVCPSWPNWQ